MVNDKKLEVRFLYVRSLAACHPGSNLNKQILLYFFINVTTICVSRIDLTASKDNMYLISFLAEQETFSKYSTLVQQLTIQSWRDHNYHLRGNRLTAANVIP